MVMPGDNVAMEVELIAPIAMDEGLRFAIREGGRTVGAGVVASIQEQPGTPSSVARRQRLPGLWDPKRALNNGSSKYSHPPEGVRSPSTEPVHRRDRDYGEANGRTGSRADPSAHAYRAFHCAALASYRQEEPRAVRDADAQAAAGHRRSDPADG